ncbi:hypothetical protein AJ80_04055 [Polytolypa hystricis UAMH7299]|uniref:Swiss Army Knife RNA repair protein HAD domain-containing protein n=1 Tax=Polytolypa hystricis (strain UAMH7299) TaxID=1447883 RepID=A0A2B7YEJ6_POLH7|nr:hypothetical protein AJ80_04055 [Polytolypa hystricis UAMH7299]
MAPPLAHGNFLHETRKPTTYSITALKRWSCLNNSDLPAAPQIKTIHVYDFDNTLFSSPLPNPQLWNGPTIGFLQTYECFANGGWWHDSHILAATGKGMEAEEPVGWKGWWNEQIVQLVELSMKQKDALTVLLTGRAEGPFAEIIKRMVKSRDLVFDLVCLKPEVGPNSQRFATTMNFKQIFLEDLVLTYKNADEIRIYEDRPKHAKGFREYFERFNRSLRAATPPPPRKPIVAEVIQVTEASTFLSPVTEAAEIQRMINSHNAILSGPSGNITKSPYGRLRVKRTIFYTGYILSNADSSRLINHLLSPMLPSGAADAADIKVMANNVLITPRPAPRSILDKVGGIGKTVKWRVTGTAAFDNRIWAARVAPIPDSETIHTDNPEPIIVLALRKGTRPADAGRIRDWKPVAPDDMLVFDAVVGQKMLLRVEEEHPEEGEWESLFMNKNNKRRAPPPQQQHIPREDEAPYNRDDHNTGRNYYQSANQEHGSSNRGGYTQGYQGSNRYHGDDGPRRGGGQSSYRGSRGRGGRGGRGGSSERGGRGRGRGRGRGGGEAHHPSYRSLDDYSHGPGSGGGYDGPDDRGSGGATGPVMNY